MNIIVTGGLGVVGSQFAEIMLQKGHNVRIVDAGEKPRNAYTWSKLWWKWKDTNQLSLFKERIERKGVDVWLERLEWADTVLHAAASTGIPYSAEEPHDDWASNVDATLKILEGARLVGAAKCPPIVALSSVKPYALDRLDPIELQTCFIEGGDDLAHGVDESFPLEPDEPYAASKAAMSMACMAWARSYGLPITVLRCSNLYGPAPCHGPRHGWLTWLCICAAIDRPIEIQGTGKQTRDMLFTSDVTSAVEAAWREMFKLKGNVYNIGGGLPNTVSVLEAVEKIESYGGSVAKKRGPGRAHEDMLFVTDHSRFTLATGWKPQVGVDAGIEGILDWATSHREELRALYPEGL